MSPVRRVIALAVALGATLAVSGLSRTPVGFHVRDGAVLRLSWRIAGISVEGCRERTAEELEALPVHMRNPKACIGTIAPYLLDVELEGRSLLSDTVHAKGARGDRPIYVFADLPITPGDHAVAVRFRPVIPPGFDVAADTMPMEWNGRVRVELGDIALLTVDGETGRIVLRTPGGR